MPEPITIASYSLVPSLTASPGMALGAVSAATAARTPLPFLLPIPPPAPPNFTCNHNTKTNLQGSSALFSSAKQERCRTHNLAPLCETQPLNPVPYIQSVSKVSAANARIDSNKKTILYMKRLGCNAIRDW
jgi:hypothetical protein